MPDPRKIQLDAAKWLLRYSSGRPEDHIRKRIGTLLESLQIEYELGYSTSSGPADIYLPRRRTVIETKVVGLADEPDKRQARKGEETPRQQLERYLRAEIAHELGSLQLDGNADRPWVGILTDGQIWHVWRYAHEENAPAKSVKRNHRPQTPEALIDLLRHVLKGPLVGKPWIPSDPRPRFEPRLEELRELHASLVGEAEERTQTKRLLWLEMLRTTSMEPANEAARMRLFVAHSFLVVLARGVIQVLANPNEPPRAEDTVGDGFVAWIVETDKGRQWATAFLAEIHGYEWRRRPGDVLRPLYEQFVDESDRKAFGEFYTPDWLAELLVREVCDGEWCEEAVAKALAARRKGVNLEGIGVLDPTCGSGTFLYHAARRILASPSIQHLSNSDKSAVVCSLVNGIDVHPVAAEIARATLLRALPTEPPHGKSDLRIHEGDALLIHGDSQDSLFRPTNGEIRIHTPKGEEVFLPRSFVERPDFADDLRRLVLAAAEGRALPQDIVDEVPDADRKALTECHRKFVTIISREGNSVWTWYIRNTTGPYRLSETKVNRVVANPPWVTMSNVQARERKRTLERFAIEDRWSLWPGGKQAPHFDIAQLFVKRTRELYLADPDTDPGAWLVKKAALKAGSWRKFRQWHNNTCKQTLDLEALKPFGGGDARRCCVLFEGRQSNLDPRCNSALIAKVQGSRLFPDASLDDISARISFSPAPKPIPQAISDYVTLKGDPLFRQGATVTPKVLTILDNVQPTSDPQWKSVTTSRSQHKPWSEVKPQRGDAPAEWLRESICSKAVLPFSASPAGYRKALIPTNAQGQLEASAAAKSSLWNALDRIYKEYKGAGRYTPRTLISRIDYGSELSSQLELKGRWRTMVLYPASGDIMRACRLCPGEAIVDFTLYRFVAASVSEAAYLVALLNAPCLNEAFAQSRDSGRDYHQHPWRKVPIPKYDGTNPAHVALARLSVQSEGIVTAWLSGPNNPSQRFGQVAMSKRLRTLLRDKGLFPKIDGLAQKLLPDQARLT